MSATRADEGGDDAASTKFVITRLVLGASGEVVLSEQEYRSYAVAKQSLVQVLALEDKFDVVVNNFLDLETELLSMTARNVILSQLAWEIMADDLNRINRRLLNLLAAARMYVDHAQHGFSELFGQQAAERQALRESLNGAYDGCLGYRVMEAMRNYAQHRSLPVHLVSHPWSGIEADGSRAHTVDFAAKLSLLEEDGRFKSSVLEELRGESDTVTLKPLVREYVGALGDVQRKVRELLAPHLARWERLADEVEQRYRAARDDGVIGLAVAAIRMENGQENGVAESYSFFREFRERLRTLAAKNVVTDPSKWYVSSKSLKGAR